MKVLYAGRSETGHDRRFVEAWKKNGFLTREIYIPSRLVPGSADWAREAFRLQRVLDTESPDIVQVGPVTYPGWVVSSLWSGPLIATSWGFDVLREVAFDGLLLAAAQSTMARADLVFVDSEETREKAIALGAHFDLTAKFPWGLEEEWFARMDRTPRDGPVRIVSTRSHDPLYRVADLLLAASMLIEKGLSLNLALVGDGSERHSLELLASSLGIAGSVSFLGSKSRDEIRELLLGSDIYVSTSPVDGTSISLLEAMATGCPVVTTDIRGNQEWIDSTSGWLYPPGDAEALSATLCELVATLKAGGGEVHRRARQARRTVEERARWEAAASRFADFADLAISNNRKRDREVAPPL